MTDVSTLNTWVEISRFAYLDNLRFFRGIVGREVELSAVVKANAYGHGWRIIAELAREAGAESYCVHSLDEALALREAGFGEDILIMGHVPLPRVAEAVPYDFRWALYNRRSAEALAAAAVRYERRVRVHLKLETGTYRQGVEGEELTELLDFLRHHGELELEGVYTHFANIEDTTDHTYVEHQLTRFNAQVEWIRAAGFAGFKRHAACSAACLVSLQTHYELVRLGISQYGIWSSKETFLSFKKDHMESSEDALMPVLAWKTRISQIKRVPAGSFIGYGCTYQTTRDTRLAILPVGYSDGYDRRLSNHAHVLIRGQRAPVRGRVCMNLTMVDVTDIADVELEDEVVLLGRQGEQRLGADVLAAWIGTIPYEVVARINAAIPRVLVD